MENNIIRIILLSIISFFLGFLSAVPIGAVQLEVIKRALHDRLKPAIALISGAFVADIIYGFVAFLGVMPLLKNELVMCIFEMISSIMLSILSYLTLKDRNKVHLGGVQHFILKSKRVSLVMGFSLGLTNPVIIFWWLLCANIIGDIRLFQSFQINISSIIVFFGAFGLASYLVGLMFLIHWTKKFFSHSFISTIKLILGIMLASLSLYFLITSIKCFLSIG